MDQELEDISKNIKETFQKLKRIESFLNGITIGVAVLLVVMIVILIRIVLGG